MSRDFKMNLMKIFGLGSILAVNAVIALIAKLVFIG